MKKILLGILALALIFIFINSVSAHYINSYAGYYDYDRDYYDYDRSYSYISSRDYDRGYVSYRSYGFLNDKPYYRIMRYDYPLRDYWDYDYRDYYYGRFVNDYRYGHIII